jgi:hypothetical protein
LFFVDNVTNDEVQADFRSGTDRCARRFSGITITNYAQCRNIGKPNNFKKALGAIQPKDTLHLLNKKASISSDILVGHVMSSQNESGLSKYMMVHE